MSIRLRVSSRVLSWMCFEPAVAYLVIAGLSPGSVSAQVETHPRPPVALPGEALALLDGGRWAGQGRAIILAAFHESPIRGEGAGGNRRFYSDADRRQLLDGVEQAAMGNVGGDASAVRQAIFEGMIVLRTLGIDLRDTAPESEEIPSRVLRVFEETQSSTAKSVGLHLLGDLLAFRPPNSSGIADVLFNVASGRYAGLAPESGILVLLAACDAGRPTLRRLYREQVMPGGVWNVWFRDLAERDFPTEEMEKYRYTSCPIRGQGGG